VESSILDEINGLASGNLNLLKKIN